MQQDLQNADCIVIEGSNMAECHPVGFQWVMEAKARGATVIHIDPRYTRTSAVADLHVPLRAGSDIVLLGGLINYVLSSGTYFRDYVVNYTNAATIIGEDFKDTEDLDGLFSGFDAESRVYDTGAWAYKGVDMPAASGERDRQEDDGDDGPATSAVRQAGRGEAHGSGGAHVGTPRNDASLEHPRCVFQILKRHFARYTPEVVEQACGVPQAAFRQVCELVTANSGRERRRPASSSNRVDASDRRRAVHPRAASITPDAARQHGALRRRHPELRGHRLHSTGFGIDIPTLFDLLPGYIPMPHAHTNEDLDAFIRRGDRQGSGRTCAPTRSACSRRGGATPPPRRTTSSFDYLPWPPAATRPTRP